MTDASSAAISRAEFSVIADALRRSLEPQGYHVHVNSNQTLITATDVLRHGREAIEITVRSRPVRSRPVLP